MKNSYLIIWKQCFLLLNLCYIINQTKHKQNENSYHHLRFLCSYYPGKPYRLGNYLTNFLNYFTMLTATKKQTKLLSAGTTNAKTAKNEIPTFILYLAPADTVPGINLCPFASDGCKAACLYTAGRGAFTNVQQARINKTKFWAEDRKGFYVQLANELLAIHSKATDLNNGNFYKVAIRLNGTSDIDHLDLLLRYTGINFLSSEYSNLLFYDYTKNFNHWKKYHGTNYKITFSRSESNEDKCIDVLLNGGNIAAVFSGQLPYTYKGFKVIDGDKTDLRYFDPSGVIVGLKAKGKAKKDVSNFVINKY